MKLIKKILIVLKKILHLLSQIEITKTIKNEFKLF